MKCDVDTRKNFTIALHYLEVTPCFQKLLRGCKKRLLHALALSTTRVRVYTQPEHKYTLYGLVAPFLSLCLPTDVDQQT